MAPKIDIEKYSSIVQLIYAAGLDSAKWQHVMANISDAVGHVRLALNGHDMEANANIGFLTHNYDTEYHSSYQSYYAATNPWNAKVAGMVVGRAIPSQAVLEPDILRRTEFYNDWIRPQDDIGTGAGITLFRDRTRFLRLSANIRFRDEETMQQPLVSLLDNLAPHMSASFDLAKRIAIGSIGSPYQAALERGVDAVFLLDYRGRVCLVNAQADRLQRDGSHVRIDRARQLRFSDKVAQRIVDTRIRDIIRGELSASIEIAVRSGAMASHIMASVAPFVTDEGLIRPPLRLLADDHPAVVVLLRRRRCEPDGGFAGLARSYGLTVAECALAKHLFEGRSVSSFADTRGVSIHTARNQLRSLMSKTDTTRQIELVSLISRAIANGPAENHR